MAKPKVVHTTHENTLDEDGLPLSQMIATNYPVNEKGQYDPNGNDLGAHAIRQTPNRLLGLPTDPSDNTNETREIEPIAPLQLLDDDTLIIDPAVIGDIAAILSRLDAAEGSIAALQSLTAAQVIQLALDAARIGVLETSNADLQQRLTLLEQTAKVFPSGRALLTGAGGFTPIVARIGLSRPISMNASGAFIANAMRILKVSTLRWGGEGNIVIDIHRLSPTLATQALLSGTTSFKSAARQLMPVSARLDGATNFTSSATMRARAMALFAGAGVLLATARQVQIVVQRFNGNGTLNHAFQTAWIGAGLLAGTGALVASATQRMAANALLAGAGGFAPDAFRPVNGAALLSGATALQANAFKVKTASALFAGATVLKVNAMRALMASAKLAAATNLKVSASVAQVFDESFGNPFIYTVPAGTTSLVITLESGGSAGANATDDGSNSGSTALYIYPDFTKIADAAGADGGLAAANGGTDATPRNPGGEIDLGTGTITVGGSSVSFGLGASGGGDGSKGGKTVLNNLIAAGTIAVGGQLALGFGGQAPSPGGGATGGGKAKITIVRS